jgi:lysophospholipase L1-like esterase
MAAAASGNAVRSTIAQKLALLALGVLVGLAVVEGSLRAAGRLFLALQEHRNQASLAQDRPYRVLCIGESTTGLGGADSYPSQLERVLNAPAGARPVTVVNKGLPAVNTDTILDRLPDFLARYRPDAVVAMMGVNDPEGDDAAEPGPVKRLGDALASLRTVKLARLGWELAASRITGRPGPMQAPVAADTHAKEERFRARLRADPNDVRARVELGTIFLAAGRLDDARPLLEGAAALDPNDAAAPLLVAVLRHRAGDAGAVDGVLARDLSHAAALGVVAEEMFKFFDAPENRPVTLAIVGMTPYDDATDRLVRVAHFRAAERCTRERRLDDARFLLDRSARLPGAPLEDTYWSRLALLAQARGDYTEFEDDLARAAAARPPAPKRMTTRNYRRLRALLRERGVRLVAVQYALRKVDPLRQMLDDDPAVVFVDNDAIFREALRNAPYERYFTDAFAGDFGHMTAEGNRLLAENVARAIRARLLDGVGS